MITRLPRWVWLGAWVMAFNAGIVNVVSLMGYGHQGVSHMTGITSQMGERMVSADVLGVLGLACVGLFFIGGAALSGLMIQDVALQLDKRYGLVLILEAVLLAVALPLMSHAAIAGLWLAACACGLQNGMATTYSGAVVRTTHVSGMFTDLGLALGHSLRKMPLPTRRLTLCITVIFGFFIGGVTGAIGFSRWSYQILMLPIVICLALAIAHQFAVRSHPAPRPS